MLLIAHRGDTINFKENTIEAFASAFEKGADGVEMDVQVNKHGEAIIVHHYLHPEGDPYPKLTDVLEQFQDKGILEIEIKSFRLSEVNIITDVIRSHNPPKTEITSSILPILPHIRKALPQGIIGALFPDKFIESWMTDEFMTKLLDGHMNLASANIVHLPPSLYNETVFSTLKKTYELHHHIHTAEKADYDRLVGLGVKRATFDDIRLLQKINER